MTTEQIIATTAETTAVATQSTAHAIASLAGSKSGKIAVAVVATAVIGYSLYKGVKWLKKTSASRKSATAQAVAEMHATADIAAKI
jgi:uncharacterized protein HemX